MNPIFRSSGYRLLLGSAIASAVGGSISGISITWLVYHYTGSTIDVAYVGLTGVLPGITLGLFAGVLADRYNRRRLMVTADLVRMVAMAALAAVLYFGGFSLFLVLAVMALVYSFSALFLPASQAILPRLVPASHLEDANGVLAASSQAGLTLGAGAGGLLVVSVGAVAGLSVNAVTFALSGALLFLIAVEAGRSRATTARPRTTLRSDFNEGLRYMRTHLPILEVTIGFLPGNFFFVMVYAFFVVYASAVFGGDAAAFGYLVAGVAGGTAAGSLLVRPLHGRRFAGILMGASVVIQSGVVGVLVVSRNLPLSLAAAVGLGITIGLINTVYFAMMQAIVPNEVLARVLSIDSVGSLVATPAGLLIGGLLAAQLGILLTYSLVAVGLLANGVLLLALKGVRSLRYGD
ncbi:MAG TPA: MFS transporter [Thermoplasmata archaeon]|nr:MFS transporter [Thermoplasmata archaeon]